MLTLVFDLDGTLCTAPHPTDFSGAEPYPDRIARVNALRQAGYRVVIDTARGSCTGQNWQEVTERQLAEWGVEYDELRVSQKPGGHVFIDDRAVHPDVYFGDGPSLVGRWVPDYPSFAHAYADHLHAAIRSVHQSILHGLLKELEAARERDATIFLVANGGSAASAQHLANGLGAYLTRRTGKGFRTHALTENVAALTGQANDGGFENVFTDQLRAFFRPGDVLIAMSCSGNSENIVRAAAFAREQGGRVIGMTGMDGGRLAALCNLEVRVSTAPAEYGPIEDAHMAIGHAIVHWLQGPE